MLKQLVDGLTDEQLKLFIALSGGICLVIGALVTSIFGALIAKWNRSATAKTEFRKLAIEAALENWRHQTLMKIELRKVTPNANLTIDSPDSYIGHMLRVMHYAADMKLSEREAALACHRLAAEYQEKVAAENKAVDDALNKATADILGAFMKHPTSRPPVK